MQVWLIERGEHIQPPTRNTIPKVLSLLARL